VDIGVQAFFFPFTLYMALLRQTIEHVTQPIHQAAFLLLHAEKSGHLHGNACSSERTQLMGRALEPGVTIST
jgi:hypothetical protein